MSDPGCRFVLRKARGDELVGYGVPRRPELPLPRFDEQLATSMATLRRRKVIVEREPVLAESAPRSMSLATDHLTHLSRCRMAPEQRARRWTLRAKAGLNLAAHKRMVAFEAMLPHSSTDFSTSCNLSGACKQGQAVSVVGSSRKL